MQLGRLRGYLLCRRGPKMQGAGQCLIDLAQLDFRQRASHQRLFPQLVWSIILRAPGMTYFRSPCVSESPIQSLVWIAWQDSLIRPLLGGKQTLSPRVQLVPIYVPGVAGIYSARLTSSGGASVFGPTSLGVPVPGNPLSQSIPIRTIIPTTDIAVRIMRVLRDFPDRGTLLCSPIGLLLLAGATIPPAPQPFHPS